MQDLIKFVALIGIVFSLFSCGKEETSFTHTTWTEYQGGPARNQFTTLDQISPDNVKNLKVAWSHPLPDSGQMQMNPIIVGETLYGIGPSVRPFALNAVSGKELWMAGDPLKAWHSTSRGVAYWTDGKGDERIYYGMGPHLYAIDAKTGEPVKNFASDGKLDLHTGLPESAQNKFIISNAPGTIYKNLIIVPVRLSEGADAAPGDVRAFDVLTGELVWTFHTIPYPGEEGYDTWEDPETYKNTKVGAVNNWCGTTLDPENGILYVPLGSASPDFYGGNRLGSNLYSDCLLALNVETGEKLWHYQFTHHDIWDRDMPSTPNLIEVERDGKKIPAVAQITKQGYVFVFDRFTGQPLFDIEEVPVPSSTLLGEEAWSTQPVPTKPAPFARRSDELTEEDISPYAENKDELLEAFRTADRRFYAPPGEDPVLLLPGYDGGGEWGGAAADPEGGILYVNSNEMAWLLSMERTEAADQLALSAGERLYVNTCASCHGKDLAGNSASRSPSLVNIGKRYTKPSLVNMVERGKGMMPGFPQLTEAERGSIADYLLGLDDEAGGKQEIVASESTASQPDAYRHTGYHRFLDSKGLPGLAPPWGTLNAIDLNSGAYLWKIPLGETPELQEKGFPTTGTENYGGPVITQNGLLFIAGTIDGVFRAFDRRTGDLLWSYQLPAAAFATPAIYEVGGKEYVVVACGGEKLGTAKGNRIVAFGL